MCRKRWAASAAALAWLLAAAGRPARAEPAKSHFDLFAPSDEVFHPLLADPREMQISAAYYRLRGENAGDVGLGHTWGMARWTLRDDWTLQWDVAGLAYSRFKVSGAVNELQTIDFVGRLPLDFRRGSFSGRAMLFHQSSHLGDDYIRRTGDEGFRYSVDGLRAQLSEELGLLRLYGGGLYLLHSVPAPERRAVQGGFELVSPAFRWFKAKYPAFLFLAQDFQSNENAAWNVNSRTMLGVRVKAAANGRAMRFQVGYFEGHSPYGQFYLQREHFADVSIAFDF